MAAEVGDAELRAASVIARTCSVFSLLGCLFVIITFCTSKAFHQKPINRLVFYASFGNIMINIGTLMSRAYVDEVNSSGCQFQGFLLQMYVLLPCFLSSLVTFVNPLFLVRMLERATRSHSIGSCQPMPTGHWPWHSTSI